jgi:hypothetical protein
MSFRSTLSVLSMAAFTALTLAGCGSTDAAREAAGTGGLPDCSQGLVAECMATVSPNSEPIAVANGASVTFADQGKPVTSLTATRICWPTEDDVDPSTCASTDAEIPEWMSVQRIVVDQGGSAWPGLILRVLEVTDSAGESFVPLPATVSVNVDGTSGPGTVNLEVACCELVADGPTSAVQGSTASYITLANKLTAADGTPMPITWRVTDTQNKFWDGSSRPDHTPPQGLQGLVQDSGSGDYTVRTEVADQGLFASDKPNFTLTPVIEVAGQQVALDAWLLVYTYDRWQMVLDNQTVNGCRTTPMLTTPTPEGELRFQITGTCTSPMSSFTITSSKA